MILHEPLKISASLLPAIQVDEAGSASNGKQTTSTSTCQMVSLLSWMTTAQAASRWGNEELFVLQCFDDLFSFIGAQVEAYDYFVRTREHGENHNIFDQALTTWMYKNRFALEDVQCEVMDRLEDEA